jgi:AbrB family looped-hinge helix DNA binding protein
MIATIDAAGRLVIPKEMREKLGITGAQQVSVEWADGKVQITVPRTPTRLEEHDGVFVAVTDEPMPPLSPDAVRDTLEHVRR